MREVEEKTYASHNQFLLTKFYIILISIEPKKMKIVNYYFWLRLIENITFTSFSNDTPSFASSAL